MSSIAIATRREVSRARYSGDCRELVGADSGVPRAFAEYLPQALLRPGARVIAFARIKPDAALGAQIMRLEPTAQAGQIVRVERGERLSGIPLRRAEAAIVLALEQHHQVAPEPPARQRVAKALGHRAEILTDDDAARRKTFLRDRRAATARTESAHRRHPPPRSRAES